MTKYAILHGNYNIYHVEFDTYEEAKEYYDELVKDEGTDFDFQLCKVLETHGVPERETGIPEGARHYGVDMNEAHENWLDIMRKLKDNWMNSRR